LLFSELTKGHKKTLSQFKRRRIKMKKIVGLMMSLGLALLKRRKMRVKKLASLMMS